MASTFAATLELVREGEGQGRLGTDRRGAVFVHADVTNTEEVQAAVDAASEMGPLRVLVNCAGIGWAQRTVDRGGNPHDLGAFEKVVGEARWYEYFDSTNISIDLEGSTAANPHTVYARLLDVPLK